LLALVAPIGAEPEKGAQSFQGMTVDQQTKTVRVEAKVAVRKLPHLEQVYPIEVVASWPHELKAKKAHETVFVTDVQPSDLHRALESLGLKPGKPAKGEGAKAVGPEINVFIEFKTVDGTVKKMSIHRLIVDPKTKKPLPKEVKFYFTGSVMTQPDPNKADTIYGADASGTFIALFPVTEETVLQSSLTMKEEKYLKMDTNKDLLPKEGAPIVLILEVAAK